MSNFAYESLGIAAIVMLVAFFAAFCVNVYIVYRKGWKSTYSYLLMFNSLRLAGQISGIGFSVEGIANTDWLIAYIVFTTEGYFVLVLSLLYFLCNEHIANNSKCYLKEKIPKVGTSFHVIFHSALIPANVLLVVGGVITAGMTYQEMLDNPDRIKMSKDLKTAGQALFLALTVTLSTIILHDYQVYKLRGRLMNILIVAIPFLIVRGVFGILAIYISDMNYLVPANYISNDTLKILVSYEYCLGVLMEFIAGTCLLVAYFIRREPGNDDSNDINDVNDSEYILENSVLKK